MISVYGPCLTSCSPRYTVECHARPEFNAGLSLTREAMLELRRNGQPTMRSIYGFKPLAAAKQHAPVAVLSGAWPWVRPVRSEQPLGP